MTPRTYIVEHLDPELETWSAYEYACIAKECHASGARFFLTSVPTALKLPTELQKLRDEGVLTVETRAVEELWPGEDGKNKVCLLDPKATTELCEEDGDRYEAFLFGGILGDDPPRGNASFSSSVNRTCPVNMLVQIARPNFAIRDSRTDD